ALVRQVRVAFEEIGGVLAGDLQKIAMRNEAGDEEARRAGLPCAAKLAFAAQLEVFLRDAETVLRLAQDRKPRTAVLAERSLVEQDAARRLLATPDPPAQLVKLGKAEALGMLDHHDRGIRHVDADFHDRRRHQEPRLTTLEGEHG